MIYRSLAIACITTSYLLEDLAVWLKHKANEGRCPSHVPTAWTLQVVEEMRDEGGQ